MPVTIRAADLVAAAKSEITTISMDDAAAEVAAGRAVLVDIREPAELDAAGRIPGAIRAPRGMLEFSVDPASPWHDPAFATDRRLILFCAAAGRSALAVRDLNRMGLTDAVEMDEGFDAWKAAGHPVERE